MSSPAEFAIWLTSNNVDRLLLFLLLPTSFVLARRGYKRSHLGRQDAGRASELMLVSAGLLACLAIWIFWAGLLSSRDLPDASWAGPLDRLISATCIAAIGWLGVAGRGGEHSLRRWRSMLGLGFGAMLLAYAGWAPRWARAIGTDGDSPIDIATITDFPRYWDASQIALATFVGLLLVLVRGRLPRWQALVVGGLALGSGLDLAQSFGAPLGSFGLDGAALVTLHAPVWSRIALLATGLVLTVSSASLAGPARLPGSTEAEAWRQNERSMLASLSARLPSMPRFSLAPLQAVGTTSSQWLARPRRDETQTAPLDTDKALDTIIDKLDDQTTAIHDLRGLMSHLNGRVGGLEGQLGGSDTVGAISSEAAALPMEATRVNDGDMAQDLAPQYPIDPALNERLTRYEAALGYLPVGIIMTDEGGRIAYRNPRAAELLYSHGLVPGAPLAQALGRGSAVDEALRRALEGGDRMEPLLLQIGSPPIQVDLFGLRPAPGAKIAGLMAVLAPVALRNETKAHRMVPELTESLRAPVSSILGYSHLLREGSPLAENQTRRYLERIDANLARLKVTLDNVAELLGTDHAPPAVSQIDTQRAIADAIERAHHPIEEKSITLRPITDQAPKDFRGHPALLDRVLDNLLVHAIQRSPQGGDIELRVSTSQNQGGALCSLELNVQDRGRMVGDMATGPLNLSAENVELPIELRIVQLLAEQQGGRAWVESHVAGVSAKVMLPERD